MTMAEGHFDLWPADTSRPRDTSGGITSPNRTECYHFPRVGPRKMVDLREPLDSLIPPPARFTEATGFPRAKEIRLYDTTLRDGEQTPGVAFTPEQKYELAVMLSQAGLHILDMGFPSAAPSEAKALGLILEGKRKGEIRKDL